MGRKARCCNPFGFPKHTTKDSKNSVNEQTARDWSAAFHNNDITAGQRVCLACYTEIRNRLQNLNPFQLMPTGESGNTHPIEEPVQQSSVDSCVLVEISQAQHHPTVPEQIPLASTAISTERSDNESRSTHVTSETEPLPGPSQEVSVRSFQQPPKLSILDVIAPQRPSPPKKIRKLNTTQPDLDEESSIDFDSTAGAASSLCTDYEIEELNKGLQAFKQTPVRRAYLHNQRTMAQKFLRTHEVIKEKFSKLSRKKTNLNAADPCRWCEKLMEVLPQRFKTLETREDRYRNLTCVPPTMMINDVTTTFGCSIFEARQASQFKVQFGPFYAPPPKCLGRPLKAEITTLVTNFYLADGNSRVLPGQRQTILATSEDGCKVRVPKRLILVSHEELYREFCNLNSEAKIGISKFCAFRPRQCVWPGVKGHHTTCVCVIHENFQLLCNTAAFLEGSSAFMEKYLCEASTQECYLGFCSECPKYNKLHDFLVLNTDEVLRYHLWETTDGARMVENIASQADFIQQFEKMVPKIAFHHFVNKHQTDYIDSLYKKIETEESVVCRVDFAMNFSFVTSRDIQSAHFSPLQCTVHPFVIHGFDKALKQLIYKSYVVVSDDVKHNSTAFHVFRNKIMGLLKTDFPYCKHIYYVSDGSAAQYKNFKNIANLVCHPVDYGVTAEWHYSATAHGKSTCDGISAVVKRETRLHSLRPEVCIQTAEDMANFCQEKWRESKTLQTVYVSQDEVKDEVEKLRERYSKAHKISGIQRAHSIIPISAEAIQMRCFATSLDFEIANVFAVAEKLPPVPPNGSYVAIYVNRLFQLGVMQEYDLITQSMRISFMARNASRNSFSWPRILKEDLVPLKDLICITDAPERTTASGRMYRLEKKLFEDLNERVIQRLRK